MYAVIKTGGKQYRVKPGDVLVVEKLLGEPGDAVAFDQVLMFGEGEAVTVGAPLVADASVSATLIETRKGEKVKIFKKTRRKGYRRTRGHRQTETGEGEVDLTPLAVLNLRARNLAIRAPVAATPEGVDVEVVAAPRGKGKAARVRGAVVEHAEPLVEDDAAPQAEATAAEPAAKKGGAPKKAAPKAPGKEGRSSVPKPSKAQAKAPVRRTSPRGKG